MSEIQTISPADIRAALPRECPKNRTTDLSDEQIMRGKRIFMHIAREVCPGYALSEAHKPVVNDIFRWCLQLPGRLDPTKGLWLCGNIGTGKSTLMRIVDRFLTFLHSYGVEEDFRPRRWLSICQAIDISDAYAKDGFEGVEPYIRLSRLVIDDLGTEPKVTGHYGTPSNVIGDLLIRRYNSRENLQTHATTNLGIAQVRAIYDDRVYDRCREMFNFVELIGSSNRFQPSNDK